MIPFTMDPIKLVITIAVIVYGLLHLWIYAIKSRSVTGIVTGVLITLLGIFDGYEVFFGGVNSSVSNFLVNLGINDNSTIFSFGFVAGHLFGNMTVALKRRWKYSYR